MNPQELIFGLVVVVLLVALALFFGWRQIRMLQGLRHDENLPREDRYYLWSQAWRRLFCSGLMLLVAGLLIGSYFLEPEFQRMIHRADDRPAVLDPEEKGFLQRFTSYWVFTLLILFLFFILAFLDIRATLRYGLSKHRQLQEDHREALAAEFKRLREERNGK